jgi:hypothetical protein
MIKRSWSALKPYWKCLSWLPDYDFPKLENRGLGPTDPFPVEEPYEKQDSTVREKLAWVLKGLKFQGSIFSLFHFSLTFCTSQITKIK